MCKEMLDLCPVCTGFDSNEFVVPSRVVVLAVVDVLFSPHV